MGQEVVQIERNLAWSILCVTWIRVSLVYVECKTKKNFCHSLPATKVRVTYGNLRISRITNFKNMSFHGSRSCSN